MISLVSHSNKDDVSNTAFFLLQVILSMDDRVWEERDISGQKSSSTFLHVFVDGRLFQDRWVRLMMYLAQITFQVDAWLIFMKHKHWRTRPRAGTPKRSTGGSCYTHVFSRWVTILWAHSRNLGSVLKLSHITAVCSLQPQMVLWTFNNGS